MDNILNYTVFIIFMSSLVFLGLQMLLQYFKDNPDRERYFQHIRDEKKRFIHRVNLTRKWQEYIDRENKKFLEEREKSNQATPEK